MTHPASDGPSIDLAQERMRAESRAREIEARFRIMADAAPVMLWMSREDSLCTFFNQTWLDFTGRTQAEEWGVGWAEGIHFEDLQRCLDTYVDAFGRRAVFEMEYRLRRADGEYRWILDRGTPRYAPDRTFAGYIGSCIDITDRRRVERELRDALRAKQDLFATASHELKSPIAALRLQLERFKRLAGDGLPERARELLDRMTASSERIGHLIESTLDFSRAQDGHLTPAFERFDLGALVQRAVDASRPVAEHKGLVLDFSTSADGARVRSDPSIVRTIVSNLIGNAIKFTHDGSVRVTVAAGAGGHTVTVEDSGQGIAPPDQAKLFEPFRQLESARNKHTPGIGLGLALAKRLAQLVGGHISLSSRPGEGSAFMLSLPNAPREEARHGG